MQLKKENLEARARIIGKGTLPCGSRNMENLEWWNEAESALWGQEVMHGDTSGDVGNGKLATHGVSHAVSGTN